YAILTQSAISNARGPKPWIKSPRSSIAVLEPARADCLPFLPARESFVCVLEHLRVPRQKSATRVDPDAAFDLHDGHRIIREAAEESGESAGGQMAATLAIPMELRLPAILDVDHRQRIVQRAE